MIGQGLADHPKLKTPFPSDRRFWVCPVTGLKVPMQIEENLQYREQLLMEADRDPTLQADLLAAARESGLWWTNTFAWTYWQFEIDPETGKSKPAHITHQPFITWECQEEAWNAFEHAFFNGEDVLVKKSRDMGASWLCTIFIHHKFLFRNETQIREMSRTEDYVDGPTSKSLFWKHDYLNTWVPGWMRPPGVLQKGSKNRTKLRIHNELNGSTIAGESTTKHAMSGDRCQVLLLDEFAKVENGEEIRTATADVTPCRIVNSTPAGPGTEYSRWKNSGQIRVVPLMFYDHPQKGRGRFVIKDPVTKRFHISSPWLEIEKKRRTKKEVAQEILAEDLEAGATFFDVGELDKHIAVFCREPVTVFNISLKAQLSNADIPDVLRRRDTRWYTCQPNVDGCLSVWVDLIEGRPDQSKTYIFGIDTSTGRGASESVATIKCRETGEKIAQWVSRTHRPDQFARVLVALALWCGGSNPKPLPFLKWEKNGPGLDLGKILVHEFKYPYFYRTEQVGTIGEKQTDKYGWHSSRDTKELLLRAYERAMFQGKFINHDKRSVEQAKLYVYYPTGGVGPAELQDKKTAEMLLHGDRVIADALTVESKELWKPKDIKPQAKQKSWGWRYEQWKLSKLRNKGWRRKYDCR